MGSPWFSAGCVGLATAVAAGAFGAHALREVLAPAAMQLWETAVRYLAIGGFGLVACGVGCELRPRRGWSVAGWLLAAGSAVFAGTVGAIALGAPRWLGGITPLGGMGMIAGFLALALAGWPRTP